MEKQKNPNKHWALYLRLSREDDDKEESVSISHQKMKLTEYMHTHFPLEPFSLYIDDGYSGTNFMRPGFQALLQDIVGCHILGILVKDLSRLGRNSPATSYYIQDYFPNHKIRFIAIDDGIDKSYYDYNTEKDMLIDMKNLFNGFYPKDISNKVRSTFRTKQRAGEFIGAFAPYGYTKSPQNNSLLVIDEKAASVVKKIYALYLSGMGQNTIARELNKQNIPCPSQYKKECGLHYHNGNRLEHTTYWTYSSIRNILRNPVYTGTMVQNKSFRQPCSKKALPLPPEKWITVPNTHTPIIDKDTFTQVQTLLRQNTRQTTSGPIHPFAGLLKCGDCGRAMVKREKKGKIYYCCGSYHQYGAAYCSDHIIDLETLTGILKKDFDHMVSQINDIDRLLQQAQTAFFKNLSNSHSSLSPADNRIFLDKERERLEQKKEHAYNDYIDGLLTKNEFLSYKQSCNEKILHLKKRLEHSCEDDLLPLSSREIHSFILSQSFSPPNRLVITEMVQEILIYKNHQLKIIYNFEP